MSIGTVPLPTQRSSLTKRSKASHSGVSKGSKHSLQMQFRMLALQKNAYSKFQNNKQLELWNTGTRKENPPICKNNQRTERKNRKQDLPFNYV